jgi:hypothetical protein
MGRVCAKERRKDDRSTAACVRQPAHDFVHVHVRVRVRMCVCMYVYVYVYVYVCAWHVDGGLDDALFQPSDDLLHLIWRGYDFGESRVGINVERRKFAVFKLRIGPRAAVKHRGHGVAWNAMNVAVLVRLVDRRLVLLVHRQPTDLCHLHTRSTECSHRRLGAFHIHIHDMSV